MEFSSKEDEKIVAERFSGVNRFPRTAAMLIHLLLKYRPARAGIHVDKTFAAETSATKPASISQNACESSPDLDGNVEAIHRTALEVMVPYVSKYDHTVVWVGNAMMNVRADVFLGPFSVVFRQLTTYPYRGKQKHTYYPIQKFPDYRHTLFCYISTCLSPRAERSRSLFPEEGSDRLLRKIYMTKPENAASCSQMSTSVNYSWLVGKYEA